MKRAIRIGDTDRFTVQELRVLPNEDGTGTIRAWVDTRTYTAAYCDQEILHLQERQAGLSNRIDFLTEIKQLINEAI